MDFQKLQALGGIVPTALVKKEIEFTYFRPLPPEAWTNPGVPEFEPEVSTDTGVIWVRKRDSRDFLEINRAPETDRPFVALFRCVCTEDGSPLFPSAEAASHLAEWMLLPMIGAVNEVNRFGPKPFPPKTSSGIGLPSPSAGEASASGSSRSTRKNARRGSRTSASTGPSSP